MNETGNLIALCERLVAHEGVTHWAVSQRIFRQGDFFSRLQKVTPKRGKPVSCGLRRYNEAMRWFSDNWPDGLDWPEGIPRPPLKEEDAA